VRPSHVLPHSIVLYTDGSSTPLTQQASWAVCVASVFSGELWYYEGFLAAKVPISFVSTQFLGATSLTADVAELSALAWAAIWAISEYGDGIWPSVVVRYDCTSAAGSAKAVFFSKKQPILANVAEVLWLFVAQRTEVIWQHVLGHNNEPFNELVDSVADAAIRHDLVCYSSATPCSVWSNLSAESIALQYVFAVPAHLRPAYPRGTGVGLLDAAPVGGRWRQLPAAILAAPFDSAVEVGPSAPPRPLSSSWLSVASYNVLTMRKTSAYHLFGSQLRQHGVAICGVQEARSKEAGTRTLHTQHGSFVVITSACSASGQYGCALWVDIGAQWVAQGVRKYP
jgi:ribonuclease HI